MPRKIKSNPYNSAKLFDESKKLYQMPDGEILTNLALLDRLRAWEEGWHAGWEAKEVRYAKRSA